MKKIILKHLKLDLQDIRWWINQQCKIKQARKWVSIASDIFEFDEKLLFLFATLAVSPTGIWKFHMILLLLLLEWQDGYLIQRKIGDQAEELLSSKIWI